MAGSDSLYFDYFPKCRPYRPFQTLNKPRSGYILEKIYSGKSANFNFFIANKQTTINFPEAANIDFNGLFLPIFCNKMSG